MIFFISLIQACLAIVSTETLTYDIHHRNNTIGQFEIERTAANGLVKYTSHSTTRVRIMGAVEVVVDQSATFKDEVLISAESVTRVNGNTHKSMKVSRSGDVYHLNSGGKTTTLNSDIRYSMTMLMFVEPLHFDRVFSEVEGEFHRIEQLEKRRYQKLSPDGDKNYYSFDNQGMLEADVDAGIYRFRMKRRN